MLVGAGFEGRVSEKLAVFTEVNGRLTEYDDILNIGLYNSRTIRAKNYSAEVGLRYYF